MRVRRTRPAEDTSGDLITCGSPMIFDLSCLVRQAVCFLMVTCGLGVAAEGAVVPPDKIDAAIAGAKRYLYSQQQPDGQWEKDALRVGTDHNWKDMQGDSFGGYTALCTYALLASGESPNNPRIKAAVEFLKHADIVGVYAVAMRCQVWLLVPHSTEQMK